MDFDTRLKISLKIEFWLAPFCLSLRIKIRVKRNSVSKKIPNHKVLDIWPFKNLIFQGHSKKVFFLVFQNKLVQNRGNYFSKKISTPRMHFIHFGLQSEISHFPLPPFLNHLYCIFLRWFADWKPLKIRKVGKRFILLRVYCKKMLMKWKNSWKNTRKPFFKRP